MKKTILLILSVFAGLFCFAGAGYAEVTCPGSGGGCSWTCGSGSAINVRCGNDLGPDRCYIVNGGTSSAARCSDFSPYSTATPGGLRETIERDKKKRRTLLAKKKVGARSLIAGRGKNVGAAGSKRSLCARYTRAAVDAHRKNLRFRCGYRGSAWTNNSRAHFNWCLKVPVSVSQRETAKRNNAINTCIKKLSYCRRYAARAIAQQRMNLQWRCGFRGALWSNSTTNHHNWCMRVNVRRSSNDTRRRDHLLRRCRAKKRASRR